MIAVCSAEEPCAGSASAGSRRRTRGSRPRRWRSAPRRPHPGRSCPPESARRAVAARHRLSGCRRAEPVVAGSARCGCARAEIPEVGLQVLLVHRHRYPIDSRTCPPLLSPERSFERRDVDMMQQGGEPGLGGLRAAAFTRARLGGKATRLCVRTLASPRGFPPGWSLPSTRLVSFDGFISTMNQSDSRPQLGRRLRHCLAALPRRRPIRRTRSGLSCSDDCLPCVIRPSTPAERHRLA